MAFHKSHPLPAIIEAVIARKESDWNDATRQTARTDAQRVLEALVAEFGVDTAIAALDRQGFNGAACRYLLTPLYEEAVERRRMVVGGSAP